MANLNKVFLMGNLTADPELRYTGKGTAVTELRLAINRYYSGENGDKQEDTTFVDVILWNRQAEIACNYLAKGRGVFIEGRLQLDTWEDKATGQKRSRLRVVGESMQLFPRGGDAPMGNNGGQGKSFTPRNNGNSGYNNNGGYNQRPAQQAPSNAPQSSGPMDDFDMDDEIPF